MSEYWAMLEVVNKDGSSPRMPFLHAIASGYKAMFTFDHLTGLEVLRQSAGGLGYSHYSGLPINYMINSATTTYEGDNYVLYQQVAKYLVKNAEDAVNILSVRTDEYSRILTHALSHLLKRLQAKTTEHGRNSWNQKLQITAI
jgi:hypothetical protein